MQTVYNAKGERKTVDTVDAREYIETGRWFAKNPNMPGIDDHRELTVAEIREQLATKGISIQDGITKKADLLALLNSVPQD